jgi:hypothetical protein
MIMDSELEAIHFWIGAVWIAIVAVLIIEFLSWAVGKAKIFFTRFLGKRKL